jgi:fatty-acyl-CoA synthase
MVLDLVREGARRVADAARKGAFVAGALNRVGALSSLSPSGIAAFARRLPGLKFRPHYAFLLHASDKPEKIAVVAGGRRYSYGELDKLSNRLANALRDAGVGRRAKVALMLDNGVEYVIAGEALPRLSASAVQIGTRLKAPEVAHILDNARPEAVICDAVYRPVIDEAMSRAALVPASYLVVGDTWESALARASDTDVPRAGGEEGGGVIVYTSGTTGRSKGANRDYADTGMGAVLDLLSQVGADHNDHHLVVCPLYHSAAPAFVKMIFALGGSLVIARKFDAEEVLELIERERITSAFMVPTQLLRLAELPPQVRRRHDTSSLRWVMSGAAPLPTSTARRFQESFGPVLWNFYGATETGLVSLAGPADHTVRPGTVGRLLFENEVKICDEAGRELPPGEIGELWVRNATMITGYHRDESATSDSTREGFFSVGDLARMDRDGYLYMESRKHDMVISGGVNIYPREIEAVLDEHPAVREAAVIGVPDPEWGESLAAFVVRQPGQTLTAEEVVGHCREHLADYKRPRQVVFVDELPRNPTGKVLKRVLRERIT